MNKLGKFTSKIKFKKIGIILIILAVIGAVLSVFAISKTLKDEFAISNQYRKISNKIDNGKYKSYEQMENDLTSFANVSNNIRDILVLDSQNNIVYSVNNSDFAKSGTFNLKSFDGDNSKVLALEENPNIYFKVIGDHNFNPKDFFNRNKKEIKSQFKEHKFYESMDNNDTTYFMTYEINEELGFKVYFINDSIERFNFAPIMKGFGILALTFFFYSLLFVIYWVLLALYVYELARKSNLNPIVWGLITLCTNIIGLFVFLIYKQNAKTCEVCGYPKIGNSCVYCDNKVKYKCEKCGAEVNQSDYYCSKCGEPIIKEFKENEIIDVVDVTENNENN